MTASAALPLGELATSAAVIQVPGGDGGVRWWRLRKPIVEMAADSLDQVLTHLREVEAGVAEGFVAVGFLSYEAAPAFEPAISARDRTRDDPPLSWWALFDDWDEVAALAEPAAGAVPPDWRPGVARDDYLGAIARIRDHIAAGDTYQVNYTFPLEAPFTGDPAELFAALCQAQRAQYCAFVDTGRFAVCSASPELFFELDGDQVVCRPMKGTARRGRFPAEDAARRDALATSAKDRAENVMIVDMVRNDLGRIARPGTVTADELFTVETFPTIHQLTSTVRARTSASVVEILAALFPCASITGAPKIRTCGLIRDLEAGPRGVYTGAVGILGPGRRARFNVAIRTAVVDRTRGVARYGVGGGVVWDSDAGAEYDECRAKALVLTAPPPRFELLETLLWRPRSGYFLLARHLERLRASAAHFGFPCRADDVVVRLRDAARGFGGVRTRVRLRLDAGGDVHVDATPFPCSGRTVWRVRLDDRPIDSSDPFFFHKTTHRRAYDEARDRHPGADEVILWNERGELTESTRANLAVRLGGEWLTPPVECGLLAGTYRAALLDRGRLRERVLPVATLAAADDVFLVNAVRGWIRTVRLEPPVECRRVRQPAPPLISGIFERHHDHDPDP